MKKFGGRRVPRKIGQDEDEPAPAGESETQETSGMTSTFAPLALPILTLRPSLRPSLTARTVGPALKRATVKPRKSANPRTSFGPSAAQEEQEGEESAASVITPKRSNLSKVAVQRNASNKRSSLLASQLPRRHDSDDEGAEDGGEGKPSYSAASLQALKDSTPATPAEFGDRAVAEVQRGTKDLDLSSKFGSHLARYGQSAIPSASEIAEKKARRARLAKEHAAEEFISLDPDDPGFGDADEEGVDGDPNVMRDESGRLVLKPKDKYGMQESRLVREDEDIMENFEDFTEDGKVHLGRKAEREAERRRRDDMRAAIAAAEGDDEADGSDDSDASERERNAAFEAAQTRHGTYAATHDATPRDPYARMRPKTPPKISPLPTLEGVIERLRGQVAEMQTGRARKLAEMEALQREKVRLAEEEVRIQAALRETGMKFQELRVEKGIVGQPVDGAVEAKKEVEGITDGTAEWEEEEEGDAEMDGADADDAAPAGMGGAGIGAAEGWLGAGGGLGMGGGMSGMGRRPAEEDDW